jgi:hypothetical protein
MNTAKVTTASRRDQPPGGAVCRLDYISHNGAPAACVDSAILARTVTIQLSDTTLRVIDQHGEQLRAGRSLRYVHIMRQVLSAALSRARNSSGATSPALSSCRPGNPKLSSPGRRQRHWPS